jgi:SnoaL-like domain
VTVLAPADALALLQLVARADTLATQRDAAGYAALFTQDAVMDGDKGRVTGREDLAAAVARIWEAEPPGTLHLTCNAVIDEAASTPAVVSIVLLLTPRPPGLVGQAAHVLQRFLQTPEGWRISSRHIKMIGAATADASQEERGLNEGSAP